jgi:hypothetical protein
MAPAALTFGSSVTRLDADAFVPDPTDGLK